MNARQNLANRVGLKNFHSPPEDLPPQLSIAGLNSNDDPNTEYKKSSMFYDIISPRKHDVGKEQERVRKLIRNRYTAFTSFTDCDDQ